jgi:hypothetical protein
MPTPKLNINDLFQSDSFCNSVYLPFSKQTILMREMVTADQKYFLKHVAKLQDKEFVQRKIGILFNDLLEKLIKDVDFTKMPLQDKLYLLLFLRGKMKGDKTQLGIKCPKCNADITFGYDLGRFQERIKKMADDIKLPFEVPVGDMVYIVDSVMISDEIETDKLLSSPDFIKLYDMDEAHLSNMLRVASAIKRIISPKGELEMSEHKMPDRVSLFMRTPVSVVSEISTAINEMTSKMADMMTDKFTVPCLQSNCDGKTEVVVAIGDEGFFIPKSSDSPPAGK